MYHIEYAALNYYHSPISDECLCIGAVSYTHLDVYKRQLSDRAKAMVSNYDTLTAAEEEFKSLSES